MPIHTASGWSLQLHSVGTPVGLYGVAQRSQRGHGRLLTPGIQVDVEVAVGTGLVTHECVDAPAAFEPEPTPQGGKRPQHNENLGQRRPPVVSVVVGHGTTCML